MTAIDDRPVDAATPDEPAAQRTGYEVLPGGHLRVPLPDGHHAEVRGVDDLRQADVRAILKAADEDGIDLRTRLGFADISGIQEATVARMVRRWTLVHEETGEPLPVTPGAVRGLRVRFYRPLRESVQPVVRELMSGGDEPDPKSGPSS